MSPSKESRRARVDGWIWLAPVELLPNRGGTMPLRRCHSRARNADGRPLVDPLGALSRGFQPTRTGSAGIQRDDRLAKEGRAIDQAVALEMLVPKSYSASSVRVSKRATWGRPQLRSSILGSC